jgi:hypothetical protein
VSLTAALVGLGLLGSAPAKTTFKWQGYTWNVKSTASDGPGPNAFSPSNAWIDASGDLHLKIAKVNSKGSSSRRWLGLRESSFAAPKGS